MVAKYVFLHILENIKSQQCKQSGLNYSARSSFTEDMPDLSLQDL